MPRNPNGRLLPRKREQIGVMADLAHDIERQLNSRDYDDAEPTMEPSLDAARHHAAHLQHRLEELRLIVEMEHSGRR